MEDEDTYGKIMARKGRTKVIYKGTFVSNRSLRSLLLLYAQNDPVCVLCTLWQLQRKQYPFPDWILLIICTYEHPVHRGTFYNSHFGLHL